ncbi:Spindle assembly checkpoint component Mad1 [Kalmanozyma brasiliensis GHG001]|uniref:Spindle assembly checkpoint component MAD1 n=1 Tax=Kalmanozyma brasiliensis (strain GHG001) TaxID=1365824 RepID=V5GTH5_KALBG|nr:Spindle assembly checkpoint component Mad1 [Kalmanozyma brasiliensis GHG001]EST09217.1 Spindle assembly checkpoint component Mad1 [Kalmanozyma brasiliensis GHG001]
MDGRRTSNAGASGIPQMRSGIPRPGGAAAPTNGADSAIPRPSSRIGTIPSAGAGIRAASGPMGVYRSASSAGRSSVGGAASGPSSMLRQAPASAAPASRTYSGLANRISTLAPRPLDPNTSTNMLGDDMSSASILLDTSLGPAAGLGGHKRTVSAAGLGDDSVSFSTNLKRPHLRKLSMDGTSPFLLQAQSDVHPASTPRPESPAYEIAVLRTHYDQQLLAESRKYKKLESDYEAKCKELDRFNRQRVELLDEWDKHSEATSAKEAEWVPKRASLEEEVVRLRSSNSELTHRNDEVNLTSSTQLAELRGRVTALESELGKAKAEAQAATVRAKTAEDEVGANKAELEDLQNALEDEQRMRMQQLDEARLGGAEQGKKIADELARQTSHLRKLEAENAHLVAENGRLSGQASNVELLKEEKRSLEVKLRTLDSLRDQLAAAETLVTELQEKESNWDAMLRSGLQADVDAAFAAAANTDASLPTITAPEVIDRTTLPRYLSTLRGTVSGLSARCTALSATVEKLRTRNLTLEEDAKDVDAKERKTSLQLTELQTSLARAQKTEARLTDEIARLKTMLSSYEQEEAAHSSATYSAAHAQRISLLEGELEKAQTENAKLAEEVESLSKSLAEKGSKGEEGEPADLQGQVEQLTGEKAVLEGKVSELEGTISSLSKELETLGKENENLWLRVGRGEFDQERQRCLVLASNPVSHDLSLRKANLDALKAENASLLSRVEELSTQVTSSSSTTTGGEALVPQSTLANLRSELHDLQTSIAAKDKSLLRLKQVFSAKANEFREAIQSLFGYKVKFLDNGKVKLTSIHNRSANSTSLVFESEEGNVGKMKLMGEAVKVKGLVDVEGLKEYWLAGGEGGRQSVPCFLAALNLELYEGCTMAVRRAKFDDEGEEDE